MLRLFVAAEFEPEFIQTCQKIQRVFLKNQNIFRLTPVDQIHLTAVFLGDTQDSLVPTISDIMTRAFTAVTPAKIVSHELLALPKTDFARVIALRAEDKNLVDFKQGILAMREGFFAEKIIFDTKPWHPHITIARTKQPVSFAPIKIELIQTVITKINLVASYLSSTGPSYQNLFSLKLV